MRKDTAFYTDPLMSSASMASSINGTPTSIQYLDDVGYQFSWSGSNPIGTITLQISLDYNPVTQSGTWTTLQTSPGTNLSIIPGGVAGNAYVDYNLSSARWIRPVYTTAGGSVGTLTCVMCAKMV